MPHGSRSIATSSPTSFDSTSPTGVAPALMSRARARDVFDVEREVESQGLHAGVIGVRNRRVAVELQHHRIPIVSQKMSEGRRRLGPLDRQTQLLDIPPGQADGIGHLQRDVFEFHAEIVT